MLVTTALLVLPLVQHVRQAHIHPQQVLQVALLVLLELTRRQMHLNLALRVTRVHILLLLDQPVAQYVRLEHTLRLLVHSRLVPVVL